MKTTDSKKKEKNLLIRLAILAFGIYLLYSLIATQATIMEKKSELETLKTQYHEYQVRNEELRKTLDSYGTDEFIEQQARAKLGYAYGDEHFYVDVSGTN